MEFVTIWGWVCAFVGSVLNLPQLIRLVRERTSAGMSVLMWQLVLAASLAWVGHGILGGWWNLIVPNGLSALSSLWVLWLIRGDRGLPALRVYPLGVAVAAVCVAADMLTTPEVFGVLVLIPLAVGMLGQFRDLVREPDISGVSRPYIAMTFLIQWMWGWWGVMAGDSAIVICAAVLAVLSLLNNVWLWLRVARVIGPRVRVAA